MQTDPNCGRLVVTRKPGQAVAVGDCVVRVVKVCGRQVVLSIEAPREVLVLREEVQPRVASAPPCPAPE